MMVPDVMTLHIPFCSNMSWILHQNGTNSTLKSLAWNYWLSCKKNEFFHMMMGRFTSIKQNSTPIWKQLMFIVTCSRDNSFGEYTKIFSNRLTLSHLTLGQDKSSYGESVEAWLGFGDKSCNCKSDLISMYWFILYGINNVFFLIKSLKVLNPLNVKKTMIICLNCHGKNLRMQY